MTSPAALVPILLITIAAYFPTLTWWFVFDDFKFLRAAQTIASPAVYVRDALDFRTPGPPEGFGFYRPLYQAIFPLFFLVFRLEAWGYHLLNLGVHLANTTLVWLIARKLTQRPLIAHGAALIFALHPAYTSAVAWVTAGNSVFATLPYLASLWFFLKYLDHTPGRLWYYGTSFLAFVAALLFHPEALVLTAPIVLSYPLLYAKSRRELLAPMPWLRVVPFLVPAIAYFQIQSWVREHSYEQSVIFGYGSWVYENYYRYLAMSLHPYDRGDSALYSILQAIAATGILLIGAVVGLRRTGSPFTGLFVLIWFLLAIVPLSTSALGAFGRKSYTVGPSLAILLAMFAAMLWDARPRRLRGWATALAYSLVLLLTLSMIARGVETRAGVKLATFHSKELVTQVRSAYPSLPPNARLHIVDVPGPLLFCGDRCIADSLRIYYGDLQVRSFATETQLEAAQPDIGDEDIVFRYHDPLRER